jgi:hypothetical protein
MMAKMITLRGCPTKMLKRTADSIAEINKLLHAWPNLNPYKTNRMTEVVTVSTQCPVNIRVPE